MNPIQVFHILGGQVVIGEVVADSKGYISVAQPYEILVAPNDSSLKTTVALVELGSLMGVMPELAPGVMQLVPLHVLAGPVTPPDHLLKEYGNARARSAEEHARIQQVLQDSQTDITRGGQL